MIRTMNKEGRGYSFDVLRAKLLLAYGQKKVQKKNFKLTNKQEQKYEKDKKKFREALDKMDSRLHGLKK